MWLPYFIKCIKRYLTSIIFSISQEGNDKESSHDKNETELVVEEYKEDEDEDEGRDEDEDDIEDDEEEDDYASMLESMCDLLSNTSKDSINSV